MDFNCGEPRRIVTASGEAKQRPNKTSKRPSVPALPQISLQGILPRGHSHTILPQAFRRKNRIRRTRRWTRHLLAADRAHFGRKPAALHDLTRKFKPRTLTGIRDVHNSAGIAAA